jgi:hypothetical protein
LTALAVAAAYNPELAVLHKALHTVLERIAVAEEVARKVVAEAVQSTKEVVAPLVVVRKVVEVAHRVAVVAGVGLDHKT